MVTRDPHQTARQDQDLQMETVYAPAFYRDRMEGPGRWVPLAAHGEPLGILWTNDQDGLGFIPTTDAGRLRTPEFAQAFSAAKASGAAATDVFNAWADRDGQGLSAGPVTTGDLDTLNG